MEKNEKIYFVQPIHVVNYCGKKQLHLKTSRQLQKEYNGNQPNNKGLI